MNRPDLYAREACPSCTATRFVLGHLEFPFTLILESSGASAHPMHRQHAVDGLFGSATACPAPALPPGAGTAGCGRRAAPCFLGLALLPGWRFALGRRSPCHTRAPCEAEARLHLGPGHRCALLRSLLGAPNTPLTLTPHPDQARRPGSSRHDGRRRGTRGCPLHLLLRRGARSQGDRRPRHRPCRRYVPTPDRSLGAGRVLLHPPALRPPPSALRPPPPASPPT